MNMSPHCLICLTTINPRAWFWNTGFLSFWAGWETVWSRHKKVLNLEHVSVLFIQNSATHSRTITEHPWCALLLSARSLDAGADESDPCLHSRALPGFKAWTSLYYLSFEQLLGSLVVSTKPLHCLSYFITVRSPLATLGGMSSAWITTSMDQSPL